MMRASRTGPFVVQGRSRRATCRCGVAQLASFKADYLDGAVDYLLGSLYNGAPPPIGPGHRGERGDGQDSPDSHARQRGRRDYVRVGRLGCSLMTTAIQLVNQAVSEGRSN